MGWSLGHDDTHDRYIGYGVPAFCDHPDCNEKIDRGLSYVCANQEPYGGDHGCGLYFCGAHMRNWIPLDPLDADHEGDGVYGCERCATFDDNGQSAAPFDPKPEHPEWVEHLLTDESWAQWRSENPKKVAELGVLPRDRRRQ